MSRPEFPGCPHRSVGTLFIQGKGSKKLLNFRMFRSKKIAAEILLNSHMGPILIQPTGRLGISVSDSNNSDSPVRLDPPTDPRRAVRRQPHHPALPSRHRHPAASPHGRRTAVAGNDTPPRVPPHKKVPRSIRLRGTNRSGLSGVNYHSMPARLTSALALAASLGSFWMALRIWAAAVVLSPSFEAITARR